MQPVIKWTGSKRLLASQILKYIPKNYNKYYEPFIGGGSILYNINPNIGIVSDICPELIELWKCIKKEPLLIIEEYQKRWNDLQKRGQDVYYEVRNNFNKTRNIHDFLFITRTCVNGLIRFNKKGNLNNSFHHNRCGINPKIFEKIVFDWSKKIINVEFKCDDYKNIINEITDNDFVFLDPPYFNTANSTYYDHINKEEFIIFLENLNKKNIKYALTLDGTRGDINYIGEGIPTNLYINHYLLKSGNCSFLRLSDKKEMVFESLYINYDIKECEISKFNIFKKGE